MSAIVSSLKFRPFIGLPSLSGVFRCQSSFTSSIPPCSSRDLSVPSQNAQIRQHRSEMFSQEKERQRRLIPRLEKIDVQYRGIPEDTKLQMNKGISTPYNVAQHLAEYLMDRSALALVNGKLWDMHRPLEEDCTIELMHFRQDDPFQVNRAFWRSCSFMLGSVLEEVFKDDIFVELHSFPAPFVFVQWNESAALGSKYSFQPTYHYHQEMESNITRANAIFDDINCYTQIKAPSGEAYVFDSDCSTFIGDKVNSGSFVHDVDLKMNDWKPSKTELMTLSATMHRLAEKAVPFERLEVSTSVALEMFRDNQYKVKQIPSIASTSPSGSDVTLYRLGDHVDISRGPMVGDSSFLGRRCTIAAAHPIQHEGKDMYRFQGVALPKDIFLNHFAFGILEKRATKMNEANIPSQMPPRISN